jgi:hypothetical protein
MNDDLPPHSLDLATTLKLQVLTRQNVHTVAIAVLLISLWITCGALSKSSLIGRLADPVTHNDVNYLIDGIRRLVYIEINGFWAEIPHLYQEPMHAPLAGYQAALGFYLFGFHDWAPYASNIVYLFILLGFCAALLRGCPIVVSLAVLVGLAGIQLLYTTISEFAPEIPCGLFTALGVVLTLRISLFERAMGPRAVAGLCFGLGFIAKPSSFAFVPLVICATLGVAFIRQALLARRLRELGTVVRHGFLHLALSLWLPALYIIPNFQEYLHYFYLAMFDPENLKAFGGYPGHFDYYLTGFAGEYMFGNFLWFYIATIAIGMAAASIRRDQPFIGRQIELMAMVFFMWLLPTASSAKNADFGAPFGYLLVFMLAMALRSIYQTIGGNKGVAAVALLSLFLLVSGTSFTTLPNTPGFDWYLPGAHIIREKWPEAMERFRAVMLGNSPDYQGRSVYLTNIGYYNHPALQYFFLKQDPTLDWRFTSLWADDDPKHHLDYIHENQADFVIAAERFNGFTYGPTLIPGAAGSENAMLAALREDPDYMVLDRFYGPTGRTIRVFQRRVAYGGWRPLDGLIRAGGTRHPWLSASTITHLDAYAPTAIAAELAIEVSGPAGQTFEILVNQDRVGQLTLDAGGKGSLNQSVNLVAGANDIVFKYASPAAVTFERLLVIRKISGDG